MRNTLIVLAGLMLAFPAYAQDKIDGDDTANVTVKHHETGHKEHGSLQDECLLENADLTVDFAINQSSFSASKAEFDKVIKQINDFAKQEHFKIFILKSMRYAFNSQKVTFENASPSNEYRLEGSALYHMDSADAAIKLAEFLTKKEFHVAITVNRPCIPQTP